MIKNLGFFFIVSIVFTSLQTLGATVSAAAPAPAPADVVYIGDSHSSGCFGQNLDSEIRALTHPETGRPVSVRSAATCGSRSSSWLIESGNATTCGYRGCATDGTCTRTVNGRSPSLQTLLSEAGPSRPRTTVVALGSNMLKSGPDAVKKGVENLIEKIRADGSACVWIGPPQAALFFMPIEQFNTFNRQLEATVTAKGCRFISSENKTDRRNLNDSMGLHYDCANGKTWATRVFAELKPILLGDLRQATGAAGARQGLRAPSAPAAR